MRNFIFFSTSPGKKPVEEFLNSLSAKGAQKVLWVLQLIAVSGEYFKKLQNTDDIWEVRAKLGNNAFRLLGFPDEGLLVILTNGFAKKKLKNISV